MKLLKIGFLSALERTGPRLRPTSSSGCSALRPTHSGDDMWAFELPDGSIAEVFGPSKNERFTTGPVVEFLVEDVEAATEELRAAGVPIMFGPVHSDEVGLAWVHFPSSRWQHLGVIEGRGLQAERP
jgi:hypothetical protein